MKVKGTQCFVMPELVEMLWVEFFFTRWSWDFLCLLNYATTSHCNWCSMWTMVNFSLQHSCPEQCDWLMDIYLYETPRTIYYNSFLWTESCKDTLTTCDNWYHPNCMNRKLWTNYPRWWQRWEDFCLKTLPRTRCPLIFMNF